MPLNLCICDDEQTQLDYLKTLALCWAAERGIAARISVFQSAQSFLFHYAGDSSADILLLDNQMPDEGAAQPMNGVELAKEIRRVSENVQIVFITGFPDFMAEGFEVGALHYLMKPVREGKLFEVLDRAVAKLREAPRYILFGRQDGTMRVKVSDILFAEAFSHTVTLHLIQGKEEFAMRMGDMETLLGEGFAKCHRSYIASLQHVRMVTRTGVEMDSGAVIPLSRNLCNTFHQAFIRWN